MLYRVGYNLFILTSILFVPWYMYIFFIFAGLYLFKNYVEALFFAAIIDSVFTQGNTMQYWFTTLFVLSFVFVQWSKTKITYYD